ncbi:MAG: carboxypeptidase-like regulatory domain-containing protein [Acidobacteriota bacterium]
MNTRQWSVRMVCMLALLLLLPFGAGAQTKRKQPEPYALVAGTVFQESGRSRPGAKVVLTRKGQPKKKLHEQLTDARGEFAFRVPAEPSIYVITATLKGFTPTEVDVEIQGQEQIHKSIILSRASK